MNRSTVHPSAGVLPLVLALLSLLAPWPSFAKCAVGQGPGATVLYPYFEVDLGNPGGLTTLISLNNESSLPRLSRLVVWTDWAIPALSFDVYLAGRDVQTINLRDVLSGVLPSTGAGANLTGFANCAAQPPFHSNPALAPLQIELLRNDLTGKGVFSCAGEPHGDQRARGFITVDVVQRCSGVTNADLSLTPAGGLTYFTNIASSTNVLWGDLLLVDPTENFAQGIEAVSIVADPALLGDNSNTFYGNYVGWSGEDRRSPLPPIWATRYLDGGVFTGGTDLLVYRAAGASTSRRPCNDHPSWYPLVARGITGRDEDTNPVLALSNSTELPLATQRVSVADLGSGPTAPFGRLQLDLTQNENKPRGAWVIPVLSASGKFSVGMNAAPVVDGCGLDPFP